MDELTVIQGENPMIQVNVGSQAIAEVVANWTGIPVGKMVSDEIQSILELAETLGKRIIGQQHALNDILSSQLLQQPIGIWMPQWHFEIVAGT